MWENPSERTVEENNSKDEPLTKERGSGYQSLSPGLTITMRNNMKRTVISGEGSKICTVADQINQPSLHRHDLCVLARKTEGWRSLPRPGADPAAQ